MSQTRKEYRAEMRRKHGPDWWKTKAKKVIPYEKKWAGFPVRVGGMEDSSLLHPEDGDDIYKGDLVYDDSDQVGEYSLGGHRQEEGVEIHDNRECKCALCGGRLGGDPSFRRFQSRGHSILERTQGLRRAERITMNKKQYRAEMRAEYGADWWKDNPTQKWDVKGYRKEWQGFPRYVGGLPYSSLDEPDYAKPGDDLIYSGIPYTSSPAWQGEVQGIRVEKTEQGERPSSM